MTVHQPFSQFQEDVRLVSAPLLRNRSDRVFDLHPAVHVMVIGAYIAFAGILVVAFMGPNLIVPAGIVAISIIALFLTPGLWARVVSSDGLRKQSWAEFLQEGVECITGRLTATQALAQILVLPGLIVGLAIVFAVLKATV